MKDSTMITLAAVGGITAIEICAMAYLGIDGVLLGATVGTLAGLAGYRIGKPTYTYHNDEALKNGQRDN